MKISESELLTILTDSAHQVERAKPVEPNWVGPDPEWFEMFIETVLLQLEAREE